jgi:hypothetical protein
VLDSVGKSKKSKSELVVETHPIAGIVKVTSKTAIDQIDSFFINSINRYRLTNALISELLL